jgi:hypothetical protein
LPFFDNNLSDIWGGIMLMVKQEETILNVITNCVRFKVGDGKTTSFWEDFWVGNRPLKLQFLRIYKLSNREGGEVSDMGL